MAHLTGLVAAPPTPMRPDGTLDLGRIDDLRRMLIANGVRGAFVCGTTGESMSLTVEERRLVAERWRRLAEGGFVVIIHVGHNCLPDCRELAAHARSIGADGIAAMAPSFFKPSSVEDLVSFCAEVAAAAPDVPFYYYHMPSMTGVTTPAVDFMSAASDRIPTLAGAKFTYEDLMDYGRCLALEGGRFDMLFGRDEILLSALALGAQGAIGTTYNFAAPLYRRIMDAYAAGDMRTAQAEQSRAREMVAVLYRSGGLSAVKPIMKMIGLDCGQPRLPLHRLDDAACRRLRADLDRLGFFGYCCRL
jgi:N-acetylneuraminate lyase